MEATASNLVLAPLGALPVVLGQLSTESFAFKPQLVQGDMPCFAEGTSWLLRVG